MMNFVDFSQEYHPAELLRQLYKNCTITLHLSPCSNNMPHCGVRDALKPIYPGFFRCGVRWIIALYSVG